MDDHLDTMVAGEDTGEDTAEDTGEDGVAGEEDTGAVEAGVDEDMAVGVAGDIGVDVFHPRDTLSQSM